MTSICKKQLVGLTGLLLIGFIGGHLAGNFFIFGGEKAFNEYAQHLADLRPAFLFVEALLALFFISHIGMALKLWSENNSARPVKYIGSKSKSEQSFASKTMPYTGLFLLVYLIWHLINYTYASSISCTPDPGMLTVLDKETGLTTTRAFGLYGVVYASFIYNYFNTAFYVIAMCVLGLHLSHGLASAIQTFGFSHDKYTPNIRRLSVAFGICMAIGFALIPLYIIICNPIQAVPLDAIQAAQALTGGN